MFKGVKYYEDLFRSKGMRHVRYEKQTYWHEFRATADVGVESRTADYPTWNLSYWSTMARVESYWDGQEGYTKTVLNEDGPLKSAVIGSVAAEFPTNDVTKKHKCV